MSHPMDPHCGQNGCYMFGPDASTDRVRCEEHCRLVNHIPSSRVVQSGVERLTSGRWIGVVTVRTQKPGYDIPPTEDTHRRFKTQAEALAWVRKKVSEYEKDVEIGEASREMSGSGSGSGGFAGETS